MKEEMLYKMIQSLIIHDIQLAGVSTNIKNKNPESPYQTNGILNLALASQIFHETIRDFVPNIVLPTIDDIFYIVSVSNSSLLSVEEIQKRVDELTLKYFNMNVMNGSLNKSEQNDVFDKLMNEGYKC